MQCYIHQLRVYLIIFEVLDKKLQRLFFEIVLGALILLTTSANLLLLHLHLFHLKIHKGLIKLSGLQIAFYHLKRMWSMVLFLRCFKFMKLVVSFLEKGMNCNEYVLGAKTESIINGLQSARVKCEIINQIMTMLTIRTVWSEIITQREKVHRKEEPLLWLPVVNMILKPMEEEATNLIAYADELVIL